MQKEVLALCVLSLGTVALAGFPYVTPTVGLVWPKPVQMEVSQTYFIVQPLFRFDVGGESCDILEEALIRYKKMMFPTMQSEKKTKKNVSGLSLEGAVGSLDSLKVILDKPCEKYPHLNMTENYELNITSSGGKISGLLESESIWGVLRGLESFSQLLVYTGFSSYSVNATFIKDGPRFSHRGLLIDTSRHYLPLEQILQTVELLAMNKFSVLHWHIVDAPSFPYVSAAFPDLSAKGAYSDDRIYTEVEVAAVVEFARMRGIRVVPEFDTPGHTESWGPGQPGLLTPCYSGGKPNGAFGPVDPTNEANYPFLTSLFTEVTKRFPDHYIHLGGDEVSFSCWQSNPQITDYMKKNNITGDYAKLEEVYITKVLDIISKLPTKNGYLVWQEVFDNGVKIAPDTVVEVWKGGWQNEIAKVTKGGFKTLLSTCWYLNVINYGDDWKTFYGCEPFNFNGTASQKALIQGGEACMWGEYVDKTTLISRTWPRASAVAEKLWSPEVLTKNANEATPRLEELRCKLLARGYNVEALGPSFCPGDNI